MNVDPETGSDAAIPGGESGGNMLPSEDAGITDDVEISSVPAYLPQEHTLDVNESTDVYAVQSPPEPPLLPPLPTVAGSSGADSQSSEQASAADRSTRPKPQYPAAPWADPASYETPSPGRRSPNTGFVQDAVSAERGTAHAGNSAGAAGAAADGGDAEASNEDVDEEGRPLDRDDRWHFEYMAFLTAVKFLTRIPVEPMDVLPTPAELRRAPVYFPLVGLLIGTATTAVMLVANQYWNAYTAVLLAMIFESLLCGGFHEDAVADCCDAFGGGWTRDDVLRILKDSRIGSFGALGLMLTVLVRASALSTVLLGWPVTSFIAVWGSVALSAAAGRWAIIFLMVYIPPIAERASLAKDIGVQLKPKDLIRSGIPVILPAMVMLYFAPIGMLFGMIAMSIVTLVFGEYVNRRLQGITGDCLGCCCYLLQCVSLLFIRPV